MRVGLNMTYGVSWLGQEANRYMSVPHDTARTLPINLLKLISCRRDPYSLRYVDDDLSIAGSALAFAEKPMVRPKTWPSWSGWIEYPDA